MKAPVRKLPMENRVNVTRRFHTFVCSMGDLLQLPVQYQNEELNFPMEMINWGYTHRFKVNLNGQEYFFEPDEEGGYRAIAADPKQHSSASIQLLQAIGETLKTLMQ
jgi:hypothetical protein